jgi:hypothetical protein
MGYLTPLGIGYQNANFCPVCSLDSPDPTFTFFHSPSPIPLSDADQKLLNFLLWYTPGTSSYQSHANPTVLMSPLQNSLFSEVFLLLVFRKMGVHFLDDVFVDSSKSSVSSMIGKITYCPWCSKIAFLVSGPNYVFSWNFFRHLRNSIAHGLFNRFAGTDIFVFKDVSSSNRSGAVPSGYIRISFPSLAAAIAVYAPSAPEVDIPRFVRSCGEALHLTPIETVPIPIGPERDDEFVGFRTENGAPLLIDCSFIKKRKGPIGCQSQLTQRILYRQKAALLVNPQFQYIAFSPFNRFTNKAQDLFNHESIEVFDQKHLEIFGKKVVDNLLKYPSN